MPQSLFLHRPKYYMLLFMAQYLKRTWFVPETVPTIVRSVLVYAAGGNKDSMLTRESSSDRGKGAAEPGSSTATAARKRDAPRTDAESGTAVEKAIGMASVAGSWAIEAGERHRKRLLQVGRDWLAGETRQDDARLEDATLVKGGSEQHAREVVADAVAENEGQPDLSKERDSSSSGGSGGSGRDSSAPGAGGAGGSDREGHVEEAWRRGSLDEPDKRR